eukprot:848003-Pelagomonas_calceolata.AAC.8
MPQGRGLQGGLPPCILADQAHTTNTRMLPSCMPLPTGTKEGPQGLHTQGSNTAQQQQQQQQQQGQRADAGAPLVHSKFLTVTPVAIKPSPCAPSTHAAAATAAQLASAEAAQGAGSPAEEPQAKRAKHDHPPQQAACKSATEVQEPEAALDGALADGREEGEWWGSIIKWRRRG